MALIFDKQASEVGHLTEELRGLVSTRDKTLTQWRVHLLTTCTSVVQAFTQTVDILVHTGERQENWLCVLEQVSTKASAVTDLLATLEDDFARSVEAYQDLNKKAHAFYVDRIAPFRQSLEHTSEEMRSRSSTVVEELATARDHRRELESEQTSLEDISDELDRRLEDSSKSAKGLRISSIACWAGGVGCFAAGAFFPPADILGWSLMAGSVGSSGGKIAVTRQGNQLIDQLNEITTKLNSNLSVIEILESSVTDLQAIEQLLDELSTNFRDLVRDAEKNMDDVRALETVLRTDDARSVRNVLAVSNFSPIFSPIHDAGSSTEAARILIDAGGVFVNAARELIDRSTLSDEEQRHPQTLLLELEKGLERLSSYS